MASPASQFALLFPCLHMPRRGITGEPPSSLTFPGPHTCITRALPTELSLQPQLCIVPHFHSFYMEVSKETSFYLVSNVQPKL